MSIHTRNVSCLLGIPVDVISFSEALKSIIDAVESRSPCMFSTPNLNFIVGALQDQEFRNSVIRSDLVFLDGMPPVWIARLLGIRGIEKVSGSNLFEALWKASLPGNRKIRVFLFGGEEGVAERACRNINQSSNSLECVGFHNPGFCTVEDMGAPETLQAINDCKADFLLVALGAKKGQSWIMANMSGVDAPVISHLGAVINFAAGSVVRSPRWLQTCGLEWLWRIWQEPALWKRYWKDGIDLTRLLACKVVPYAIWRMLHLRRLQSPVPVEYSIEADGKSKTFYLRGDCLRGTIEPLKNLLENELKSCGAVTLDLKGAKLLDGSFLGLCLLLYRRALLKGSHFTLTSVNRSQRRIFRWNCVEYLLSADFCDALPDRAV